MSLSFPPPRRGLLDVSLQLSRIRTSCPVTQKFSRVSECSRQGHHGGPNGKSVMEGQVRHSPPEAGKGDLKVTSVRSHSQVVNDRRGCPSRLIHKASICPQRDGVRVSFRRAQGKVPGGKAWFCRQKLTKRRHNLCVSPGDTKEMDAAPDAWCASGRRSSSLDTKDA